MVPLQLRGPDLLTARQVVLPALHQGQEEVELGKEAIEVGELGRLRSGAEVSEAEYKREWLAKSGKSGSLECCRVQQGVFI